MVHFGALGRRLEREQQTVRAHAYIVSRLVWADDPPPYEEFVLGHAPDAFLTPEERGERDAAMWDRWLVNAEKKERADGA